MSLSVRIASALPEVRGALRLRHEAFSAEPPAPDAIETDDFDGHCIHLIVQETDSGDVVGTYRMLPGVTALQNRGFYSETFFDLTGLSPYMPTALELGRSCIAPGYRNGRVLNLLWQGIGQWLAKERVRYLIGCVSLHLGSPDEINEVHSYLHAHHRSPQFSVFPREQYRIAGLRRVESTVPERVMFRKLPPLLKGYLSMGAQICGDPAYDPGFDTVVYFIVMETSQISGRYQRSFMPGPKAQIQPS